MDGYHQSRRVSGEIPRRATSNGFAAPEKSFYQDVFGGGHTAAAAAAATRWPNHQPAPPRPVDYAEIFGGLADSCSIPVLDLPPAPDEGFGSGLRSSELDYLDIFGGSDSGDLGLSYEEMFGSKYSANGRTVKGMETYLHTDFISKSYFKEQNGDNITFLGKNQFSSIGTSQKFNGDAGQINMSCQMEIERPKPKAANGSIHVDEPHTLHSTSEADVWHSLQNTKNISRMELNCTVPGNNLRNDVPPANICNGIKKPEIDVKVNQKTSYVQLIPAEDNLGNEQYHSCSSSEHSTFDLESSGNDCSNVDQHIKRNINGEIVDESNSCESASPTTSSSSRKSPQNGVRADRKHDASEDVPSCGGLHSCSDNLKSNDLTSSGRDKSFPSQSTSDCLQKSSPKDEKMEYNISAIASNMEMKGSGHLKADQEQSSPVFTHSEDGSTSSQHRKYLSTDVSTSHAHSSSPDVTFVTVTDINLRTGPSQVPPPSRPPPRMAGGQEPPKVMMGTNPKAQAIERNCRPGTRHQTLRGVSETDRLNKTEKTDPPPYFEVEVDVSSAAAAAAMKEAMEQAQARLKSAKESMERKKANIHHKKMGITNTATFKEGKMDGAAQAAEMLKEEIVQATAETYDTKRREFSADNKQKTAEVAAVLVAKKGLDDLVEEFPERLLDKGSEPTYISSVRDETAAEWKVEKQFFELVNSHKKVKKLSDISEQELGRNKSKAPITVNENGEKATKLPPELKKKSKILMVDEALELENSDMKTSEATLISEVEGIKVLSQDSVEVMPQENIDNVKKALDPQRKEESVNLMEGQEIHDPEEQKVGTSKESCTYDENENGNECAEAFVSKDTSEIESQEERHKYLEETYVCQENKEINAGNKNCNPEEGQRKPKHGCPFELHVNATEIEEIPISDVCAKLSEDGYIAESIKASNDSCNPEIKSISEEAHVLPMQNGEEIRETQDVNEHMENENNANTVKDHSAFSDFVLEKKDCCLEENEKKIDEDEDVSSYSGIVREAMPMSEKVNEKNLDAVEDASTCSGTEEMETKKETRWQYFCEKIIGDSEETLRQGSKLMQEKVDANSKVIENVQTVAQESQEIGIDGSAKECEPAVNSEEGSSRPNTTQEAFQNGGNENVVDDAPQNISSQHSGNAEGIAEGIHEMSKTEELVQKERMNKEMEVEKERIRKLEEEKERQKKLEDEKERTRKLDEEKERIRKLEEEKEREREREKDRQAVERANRESRERAFAEARERAERAAVERATAEARQRALMEARERAEKASAEALFLAEKASREARLRTERAAVERATAEARERAVERALAEKAAQEAKERAERSSATARDRQRKDNGIDGYAKVGSREDGGMRQSTSSSDLRDSLREPQKHSNSLNHASYSNDKVSGSEGDSAIRCKARLERHQRTVERAAKALAEKNMRDILAQREQAERNRVAETLDADVRRWSSGKEGNLRALLSTLQYILGPESGWLPIPLTDVITAAAVKKAYRKATLCVHPDKLQQRGANIQQKYICEKVFDLLKDAWNRFNSEER